MNINLFLEDLKGLTQKDFNYKFAVNDRKTGKSNSDLIGKPLKEVLKNNKVCISGYLLSKLNMPSTIHLENRYNFTPKQLDCIILAEATITFSNKTRLKTPKNSATLETVMLHIGKLFKNPLWVDSKIENVITENSY